MPWIELFGTSLNQNQKKELGAKLVEVATTTLKVPKEMGGVHFMPYQPENIYWQGGLQSEKPGEHMYHMTIHLPQVTLEQKKEIYRNLTNAFAKFMNLSEEATHKIGINLEEAPMENYAMGGRPMSEQLAAR